MSAELRDLIRAAARWLLSLVGVAVDEPLGFDDGGVSFDG